MGGELCECCVVVEVDVVVWVVVVICICDDVWYVMYC